MTTTCYLSGPIDEQDEKGARRWRERATILLRASDIQVLDPLRGMEGSIDKSDYTPAERWLRDVADVEKCDVVLCCWNRRDGYASWGTPGEAALAAYLRKPVVFVMRMDDPLRDHPWTRFQAARFFTTVEQACDYITDMWRKP